MQKSNATLMALLWPFLQLKSNKYNTLRVCVCSLRYPTWNAHTSYRHLWSVSTIFFWLNLINGTIFGGKNLLAIKCVLIFSTNSVWNISHSKKISARSRYCQKCTLVFTLSASYSRQILMKLEFSPQIFEKYSYQVSLNSVQWQPGFSMRAGGHDTQSRFS